MTGFNSARVIRLLCVCGLGIAAIPLHAATNVYVNVQGLACGGTSKQDPDAFDAISFSFGATSPEAGESAGGAGGTAKLGDVVVLKNFDKCTPKLFDLMAKGQHVGTVTIKWWSTSSGFPFNFMTITLTEGAVAAVNYGSAQEGVSFAFGTITITYSIMNADGSSGGNVSAHWP